MSRTRLLAAVVAALAIVALFAIPLTAQQPHPTVMRGCDGPVLWSFSEPVPGAEGVLEGPHGRMVWVVVSEGNRLPKALEGAADLLIACRCIEPDEPPDDGTTTSTTDTTQPPKEGTTSSTPSTSPPNTTSSVPKTSSTTSSTSSTSSTTTLSPDTSSTAPTTTAPDSDTTSTTHSPTTTSNSPPTTGNDTTTVPPTTLTGTLPETGSPLAAIAAAAVMFLFTGWALVREAS